MRSNIPKALGRGQEVSLSLQCLTSCKNLFHFRTLQISQDSVPADKQGPCEDLL